MKKVAVIVQDGAEPFGLGSLVEVWGEPYHPEDDNPVFDFQVCTPRPGPGARSLRLRPRRGARAGGADGADLVCLVPSATSWSTTRPCWTRSGAADARDATIYAHCSGVFEIGAAGLLHGRECTTHWRYTDLLSKTYPEAKVSPDVLYCHDGNILTGAGSAAGIDASLHLMRDHFGAKVAATTARRIVVPPHREGGQAQFIANAIPDCDAETLGPLLQWIVENIGEDLSVETLARRNHMSARTFARRFRAETGTTPHSWVTGSGCRRRRSCSSAPTTRSTGSPTRWASATPRRCATTSHGCAGSARSSTAAVSPAEHRKAGYSRRARTVGGSPHGAAYAQLGRDRDRARPPCRRAAVGSRHCGTGPRADPGARRLRRGGHSGRLDVALPALAGARGGDTDVDFVGPHRDVYDNVANLPGSDAYADPDFDRDHGARWATLLAEPEVPVAELVATYHPDVIVETRGLNDLINAPYRGWTTEQVADRFVTEIGDARAVDPTVDVVVAQLPQTWLQDPDRHAAAVRTLNGLLNTTVAELDEPTSRVVVAGTGTGFVEGDDTWDPAHLTASGEIKMAAGIADALAIIGVGEPYPRPLPVVENGHWGAARLTVTPADGGAVLSWVSPPGAREEFVWIRDATAQQPWVRLPYGLEGTTWTAWGLVNGSTYEFRLQARKGTIEAVGYSDVVAVTPGTPAVPVDPTPGPDPTDPTSTPVPTPTPQTLDRPGHVVVTPGSHRLGVTWDPVRGAAEYDVTWVGRRLGLRGSAVVTSPAARITYVLAGERYAVTVTARNAAGSGPVARAVGVPRGPTVPAPARLRVQQVAAHRALLTWRHRAAATSYSVEVRRHGRWEPVRTVVATALVVRRLPRGVATFRVRPWHQLVAGRWSHEVRVRMGA